jgi:nicotinamidase-related amidase/GNAT superfamily N-acetyltransferase
MEATALVLVDLQAAAFGGHGIPAVHDPDLLLGNVRALLQAARMSALPVVHIQHCAAPGSPGEAFAEGAPGWPIFPAVGPEGSEPVVRKRARNAFEGTDLHARLQAIGARTLVVAGLQTEHCVAATCRGALRLGYAVQLAADGHSTWPDGARSADEIMAAECAALEAEAVTLRSTERLVESLRASVAVLIERLSELPAERLGPLVAESERAGLRFVRRLADEWTSGRNRFDRPGERLFAAVVDGRMIGVCGLNVDPYAGAPTVGRVRHLYVLSAYRKVGVGQRLVGEVVAAARGPFGMLRLRTENPAAARLYERLGFRRCSDIADCTHLMELR